jgi:hypothetical protein
MLEDECVELWWRLRTTEHGKTGGYVTNWTNMNAKAFVGEAENRFRLLI